MNGNEFDELLDGFVKIVIETVSGMRVEEYFPTAMIVDNRGAIALETILSENEVPSEFYSDLAFAFGELLATQDRDLSAVFVAWKHVSQDGSEEIVISGALAEGKENLAVVQLDRLEDRSFRVSGVRQFGYRAEASLKEPRVALELRRGFVSKKQD